MTIKNRKRMRVYIYFSFYIILWSILYYLNLMIYNPLYWLYIAILFIVIKIIYLFYYNTKLHLIIYTFITMILSKIIMVLLINGENPFNGFIFGILLFMIYLYFINFDLYNIYYTQTTEKILNDEFDFFRLFEIKNLDI